MSNVAATDDTSLTTHLKTELEKSPVREQRQLFLANIMSSLNGTFPLNTKVGSIVISDVSRKVNSKVRSCEQQ